MSGDTWNDSLRMLIVKLFRQEGTDFPAVSHEVDAAACPDFHDISRIHEACS
jgi:hypothetical protein